jgi:hypothetical protein
MPCVGFEPTIPVSERAETVYGFTKLGSRDRHNKLLYNLKLQFNLD